MRAIRLEPLPGAFYHGMLGLPYRWQDEESGALERAVMTFFARKPLDIEQVLLLREYCKYYINAPCWDGPIQDDEEAKCALAQRRREAGALQSADAIEGWLYRCLEMGIDPL